jgi:MoaA/NifB/PqqE/SkfB family radical SAM enzyme
MYKVKSRWNHDGSIKIEWNIGKRCNYNCSYCPSIIHDNHSPHTDIDILKATVDKMATLGKVIRLSLTGGEPCVHPKIEELIQYIKSKGFWLSITTNGTRKSDWYIFQSSVDQWVFSLHFEYDWLSVLATIEKVAYAVTKHILVNVMAHHKHMSDVRTASASLEFHSINYGIRRIRWTEGDHDLFDDMKYDQKDLDWILSKTSTVKPNVVLMYTDREELYHANDVIKKHLNQYNGWQCNAGLESLMINYDGDVHRATCRVGDSLGNIYNDTFISPTDPVTCDRNYCTCAADIPLTKVSVIVPEKLL